MEGLRIGIAADDITGAADTAAALARPGVPVPVSLDVMPRSTTGRSAFAVTTDSRACPPERAYDLVLASTKALLEAGARLIYKKVDSSLRGNVGAELAAVVDGVGAPVVLAPAFPARGRTTVDGVVLVKGTPIARTEVARDPEAPAVHSHILDLLKSQRSDLAASHCPLSSVREGPGSVASRVRECAVLVVDAETDSDLDVVVEAALSLPSRPTLSGSAGLAAALGRRLSGPSSRQRRTGEGRGPVVGVLASASRTLQRQAAAAEEAGLAVVPFVCQGLSREESDVPELTDAIGAALAAIRAGRDVVVHAVGPLPLVERPVDLVVEHLAHLAFVLVRRGGPLGLLVGGGSTAQAVLSALGARALEIDEEPLPGTAAGLVLSGHLAGHPVVLKPGAAGDRRAVVDLLAYLRRRAGAMENAT
jgi:uncharacterized protein YgbK (DUF1537 family)